MTLDEVGKIITFLQGIFCGWVPGDNTKPSWFLVLNRYTFEEVMTEVVDQVQRGAWADDFAPRVNKITRALSRKKNLTIPETLAACSGKVAEAIWRKVDKLYPSIGRYEEFDSPEDHAKATRIRTQQRIKYAQRVFEEYQPRLKAEISKGGTLDEAIGIAFQEQVGLGNTPEMIADACKTIGGPSQRTKGTRTDAVVEAHQPPKTDMMGFHIDRLLKTVQVKDAATTKREVLNSGPTLIADELKPRSKAEGFLAMMKSPRLEAVGRKGLESLGIDPDNPVLPEKPQTAPKKCEEKSGDEKAAEKPKPKIRKPPKEEHTENQKRPRSVPGAANKALESMYTFH